MKLFKKMTPSKSVVKQAMRGHAWIGLFWASFLYLICLSGTLVVFYPEMERWEQPLADEYSSIGLPAMDNALQQIQQHIPDKLESLYFIFPNKEIPRAHVSAILEHKDPGIETEWWIDHQGKLVEPVSTPWTEMLTQLHIYLHLPNTLGIILVGMLGAMMCGLMISGLLAHPNLFKDAFKLRLGSNRHMEQTDIHNRLSVWGLPFFFIISLTGAYIGLFAVSMTVVDWFEKDHDPEQIISTIFGDDPTINETPVSVNLADMFSDLEQRAPKAEPIYWVLQKPGTRQQYVEIAAGFKDRLIYSEIYRYHSDGRFIDYQHLSDGDTGRQVAYSSYRIHFGHFGGMSTKILYLLLGFAMTVIVVSGVNMWFSKRKLYNHWFVLWRGFVWSVPAAIALTALATMLFSFNAVFTFWTVLTILSLLSLFNYRFRTSYLTDNQYVSVLKCLTLTVLIILAFYQSFKHSFQTWYLMFSLMMVLISAVPLINYRTLFRPST